VNGFSVVTLIEPEQGPMGAEGGVIGGIRLTRAAFIFFLKTASCLK